MCCVGAPGNSKQRSVTDISWQVKGMWTNPLLMRFLGAWHALLIEHKASSINARVLATWAGGALVLTFCINSTRA